MVASQVRMRQQRLLAVAVVGALRLASCAEILRARRGAADRRPTSSVPWAIRRRWGARGQAPTPAATHAPAITATRRGSGPGLPGRCATVHRNRYRNTRRPRGRTSGDVRGGSTDGRSERAWQRAVGRRGVGGPPSRTTTARPGAGRACVRWPTSRMSRSRRCRGCCRVIPDVQRPDARARPVGRRPARL